MDDERCCGTGTCIINAEGYCWCGQKWDGQKMCFPEPTPAPAPASAPEPEAVREGPAREGAPHTRP